MWLEVVMFKFLKGTNLPLVTIEAGTDAGSDGRIFEHEGHNSVMLVKIDCRTLSLL